MSQDDDASDAQVRQTYRRMRTSDSPGPVVDARIRAAAVAAADARRADGNDPQSAVVALAQLADTAVPTHDAAVAGTRRSPSRRLSYLGWGGALAAGLALVAVVLPMGKPAELNDAAGSDPAAVAPLPSRSGERAAATPAGGLVGDVRGDALTSSAVSAAGEVAARNAVNLSSRNELSDAARDAGVIGVESMPVADAEARAEAKAETMTAASAGETSERRRADARQNAPLATRPPLPSATPSPLPAAPPERSSARQPVHTLSRLSGAGLSSGSAAAADADAALVDLRRLYRTHDAALLARLRVFVARYPDYPLSRTDPELAALLPR